MSTRVVIGDCPSTSYQFPAAPAGSRSGASVRSYVVRRSSTIVTFEASRLRGFESREVARGQPVQRIRAEHQTGADDGAVCRRVSTDVTGVSDALEPERALHGRVLCRTLGNRRSRRGRSGERRGSGPENRCPENCCPENCDHDGAARAACPVLHRKSPSRICGTTDSVGETRLTRAGEHTGTGPLPERGTPSPRSPLRLGSMHSGGTPDQGVR